MHRGMLRWVFERLETTPGQERVISDAVEAMRAAAEPLRGEWSRSRVDVARGLRAETFDRTSLREAWVRQDERVRGLRDAMELELARVHEALDERQRRMLGDLIEGGWSRMRWDAWGER